MVISKGKRGNIKKAHDLKEVSKKKKQNPDVTKINT